MTSPQTADTTIVALLHEAVALASTHLRRLIPAGKRINQRCSYEVHAVAFDRRQGMGAEARSTALSPLHRLDRAVDELKHRRESFAVDMTPEDAEEILLLNFVLVDARAHLKKPVVCEFQKLPWISAAPAWQGRQDEAANADAQWADLVLAAVLRVNWPKSNASVLKMTKLNQAAAMMKQLEAGATQQQGIAAAAQSVTTLAEQVRVMIAALPASRPPSAQEPVEPPAPPASPLLKRKTRQDDRDDAFVSAKDLLGVLAPTHKALLGILEHNPSIRRKRPIGANGQPRNNRLLVHAGDWTRYASSAGDAGGDPDETAIARATEAIRSSRARK